MNEEQDDFVDPLFKGCTRPAMVADIPMLPFFMVTGVFMWFGMMAFLFLNFFVTIGIAILYIPIFLGMQQISKKDDQRLNQMFLKFRVRAGVGAVRGRWGAISYSPIKYRNTIK